MPLRWMLTFALAFATFAACAFGYVFVQTTHAARTHVDDGIAHELAPFAGDSPAAAAREVRAALANDEHRTRFAALFDARGRRLAGNLQAVPRGLVADGTVRDAAGVRDDARGRKDETMRAAALRLAGGTTVVIGGDLDALDLSRRDLAAAILAGLIPALAVALALGIVFGAASQRRIGRIERAIDRIAAGDFTVRLPQATGDRGLDRIAAGVNRMLVAIERLLEEIRGLGDDMAHDLRTPLGRVRAQLERSRDGVRTAGEFHETIDRAIAGLDQALAVIVALLRIGEIEHRERRGAFGEVDLGALARDVADLFTPIAEEAGIELTVREQARATVDGDRDLLFEALANLVDNAIKFTPSGGHVALRIECAGSDTTASVADDGPGIPAAEREAVLERFVRGDKSRRHTTGNGLGLSLVAAIARLHEAALTLTDNAPGCVATLAFAARVPAETHGRRGGPVRAKRAE